MRLTQVFLSVSIVALTAIHINASDSLERPLTISASVSGGMQWEDCWYLSVNSAGQACLTIGHLEPRRIKFNVTKEQMDAFLKLAEDTQALKLAGKYGTGAPDEIIRTLTLTIGRRTAEMKFHGFDHLPKTALPELRKACRIRHAIRSWIDQVPGTKDILDMRDYENNFLKIIEKSDLPRTNPASVLE